MELDLVQQQKQMNLCKYISDRVAASMFIIGEREDSISEGSPDAPTNRAIGASTRAVHVVQLLCHG